MDQLIEIAKRVLARRATAIIVPPRVVGMRGAPGEEDWTPRPHYCHDNVAAWVYRSPQHKHVRGYIIFDFRMFGFWKVQAHSVVELEDGTLIDITPNDASQLYPFVLHEGTDEEFAAMAAVIQIDVPANQVM
jgi:hypothetical protein